MYYDMRPHITIGLDQPKIFDGTKERVFFFFGPSSSRRDGVILFVSMDGKSPRLAASAVSVVVAASVMLLTQRPGLGRIFQSQFRYLAASMKGIRVRHG